MIPELNKEFSIHGNLFSNPSEVIEYSKNLSEDIFNFLQDWFSENEIILVNTSGSTGKPKPIPLKKVQMINSAKATGDFFNLPSKTKSLSCLPIKFIAGKMMWVRAMVLGWDLHHIEATSFPLKNLEKNFDFAAMVPLQVHNSLEDLFRIKKILIGGSQIPKLLLENLKPQKNEIYLSYGMTETITHIAVSPINLMAQRALRSEVHVPGLGEFSTLPDIKIGVDKRGCLVIEARKVSDEILVTNDLVNLLSPNTFQWLGRFDNVINSGGIKHIPEVIEKKLSKLIDKPFFISSFPDEILGEKLVLFVEGDFNIPQEVFSTVLQKHEIPKEIIGIPTFVYTETEKINRDKTKESYLKWSLKKPFK